MSSSTSPIIPNNNDNANSSNPQTSPPNNAATMASSVFTKQNMNQAALIARQEVAEAQKQAHDGDISLRLVALLGGILLLIVSTMNFVIKLLSFKFIGAILELFTFGLAVIIILLEAKTTLLPQTWVDQRLHKYALFLKYMWGRGAVYFLAGALQLSHFEHILDLVSGGWMCIVGLVMVVMGYQTAGKLKAIRSKLYSEEDLESKFQQANVDGAGLDASQFRSLTMSVGLDLNRRETEVAFSHLTKSNKERLSYEEFHQWWTESAEATELADNSFVVI